ncbi:TonB-dependent receptor [Taibaiella sp. KBW10]|uniref:TonB-dependent receptor plug domain-containing protein n=1 Tax=Taibaiella sp. KBW10 TaxID=2153357 RepID=UPI000F5AD8D8|nr:TonB-dependent receptor [Taibaiella sp. KBW10]RQO30307.1 TonB-dependent receptor [Taibaiella sp. KBW10]
MTKNLLSVLSGTLLSLSAFAQADSTTLLDNVSVFSNRIDIPFAQQNRNVTVISKEDLATMPAKSINEILSFVAGVDVRQRGPNGAQADIGIDGGGFDQVLVLVNGVKMSDPQTGHNMMNIPVGLSAIQRIEILKGAAARIYGVNAMMGVINIVTISPMQTGIEANVYAGSSFQKDDSTRQTYINYGANAVASFASGHEFGNQISLGIDKGNGYRYNTAYQNVKLMYNGVYAPSKDAVFNVMGGYVNNDFGANLFYAAPRDKEATEQVQVAMGSISGKIKASSIWTISPILNYRYAKDDYIFIRQKPAVYRNLHETNTVDFSLNNSIALGKGTLGIGLNYRGEQINSSNLGKNKRDNYGLFGEYRYVFSEKFDASIGAFANYNSVYGFKLYPGVDLGWQASTDLRIYANVGTGQRLPTFTDLYYVGPSNIGNANLAPEWATTAELGAKYTQGNLRLEASGFYRKGVDFIDWTRPDTLQPWQPQNYASVSTLGLRVQARYLWDIAASFKLNIQTGYTYLNPVIDDLSGNTQSKYAINSLQHQWVSGLEALIGKGLSLSVKNRYVQRLNTPETSGSYKLRSYNLLDARVAYTQNRFTIYADVNNMSNVQYIETGVVPLPGTWTTLGLKYRCF